MNSFYHEKREGEREKEGEQLVSAVTIFSLKAIST
jgi:hypothetical protein